MSDISDGIYDYELVKSGFGAVVATIIGLVMLAIGIAMLAKKQNKTSVTNGTISAATCHTIGNNKEYNCQIMVHYDVNGIRHQTNLSLQNFAPYKAGDTIDLEYDPNNPSDVAVKTTGSKIFGTILIIFGIVIIALTWGYFYLVRHNKDFGTVMGVNDIASSILR